METSINQRFRAVIDYLKFNKFIYNETDFCEKVGFVKSFLSDMKNGKKKITEQSVMKIVLAFPIVNPLWLLYGNGEMLKGQSMGTAINNGTNNGNIIGCNNGNNNNEKKEEEEDISVKECLSMLKNAIGNNNELIEEIRQQNKRNNELTDFILNNFNK